MASNQATDDNWSYSEAAFAGTFFFDVRANDALKRPLHSIDNGQVADLSSADLARSAAASSDRSALGATIWITNDGRIGYSADSIRSLADRLAEGESLVDSFLYSMKQGSTIVWATARITITGTNDAPVAIADLATVGEDALTTGSVATNDHDVDNGAVLQFSTVGQLPAGFAMAADGSWVFDGSNPAYQALRAGETTQLTVSYTVTDQHGATSSSTLQLAITGTNDAPVVASTVFGTATEDGASSTLNAVANASDVDAGTTLLVVNVPDPLPAGVSYHAAARSFTLDPTHAAFQSLAQGETTTVSVSYGVSDGIVTTPASVSWNVTGTNDAPVVTGAATSTAAEDGASSTLDALAGASDVDAGTTLSVVNVPAELPPGVSYDAATNSFTLDPTHAAYQSLAQGATTTVSVNYGVSDGVATTPASVGWTVTGANDAPVVTGAVTGTATEDGASSTLNALANAADVDAGTILSVVNVPAELPPGVSYDAATKSFTLDPGHAAYQSLAQGATTVSVSYGVSDGIATTPASVRWTVTGTNDAPVVTGAVTSTAAEDGANSTLNALANSSDVDAGTTLSVVNLPAELPPGVSYDVATNSFTLDPTHAAYQSLAQDATTTVSVNYGISDGIATTPASVSWTVTGTNDAPVVIGVVTSTATEDGASSTLNALANASDIDAGTTLSVVNVPAELPPGVSYDMATKTFALDPTHAAYQLLAQGTTTTVSVSYGVSDGVTTTPASVSWTVTGTSDAPVVSGAVTGTATEDGASSTLNALANASDVDDGTSLLVVGVPAVLPAGVSYDPATKNFTLDPTHAAYQSLAQDATATVSVNYGISDGIATTPALVSWTVTGTNDGPIATAATGVVIEDGATSGQLAATDSDNGAALTYALIDSAPAGLVLASDGSWTFDANQVEYQALAEGEQQVIAVAYNATDEHGTSSASALTLTVTGANDRPVTTSQAAEVAEDETVSGQLFAMDADSAAQLTFALAGEAPAGFSIATDGSWAFDASHQAYQSLAAGEILIVEVPFTVTDEHGSDASSLLTIAVTGTNDGPVVSATKPALPNGVEDNVYILTPAQVLEAWSDPEGSPLVVRWLTALGGTTTSNADGSWSIRPQTNFAGSMTISYSVGDGTAARSHSIMLNFAAVNDPATFGGMLSGSIREDAFSGSIIGDANCSDPDNPTDLWRASGWQASTNGWGSYRVTDRGVWEYRADNSLAAVNNLNAGQQLVDSITLVTSDGTVRNVDVTIIGRTDWTYVTPNVSTASDSSDFDTQGGAPAASAVDLQGTSGNDFSLNGSNFSDIISAEAGSLDSIYGYGGDDLLYGDFRDLTAPGDQAGRNSIYGGSGNDTIYGGAGEDVIYGGSGADVIHGNSSSTPELKQNRLYGGSGDDTIHAGEYGDRIDGGTGADLMYSGAGADAFVFMAPADTGDTIVGYQQGVDMLDFMEFRFTHGSSQFVGKISSPELLDPGQIGFMHVNGNTVVYFDAPGTAPGIDFEVTLIGQIDLVQRDMLI